MAAKKPNVVQKVRNHETYNKRVLLATDVNEFTESLNDHADKIDELTLVTRTSASGGIVFDKPQIIYNLTGVQNLTIAPLGNTTGVSTVLVVTSGATTLNVGDYPITLQGDYDSLVDGVYTFNPNKQNSIVLVWANNSLVRLSNQYSAPIVTTAPNFVSAEIGSIANDILTTTVDENSDFGTSGLTLVASGGPLTISSYISGNGTNIGQYQLNRSIANGETITLSASVGNGIVGNTWLLSMEELTNEVVTNNVAAAYSSDNSLMFNGVDEYINIPKQSIFDIDTEGTKSISYWVYPTSFASLMTPIAKASTTAATGGWLSQITTSGKVRGNFRAASNRNSIWESSASLVLNTWSNVIITWNALVMKIYINGVDVTNPTPISNTLLLADDINPAYDLKFATKENLNDYFVGNLDEITIFNQALTPEQALYVGGGVPKDYTTFAAQGLTFAEHWQMNENNAYGVVGYHGTGVNMDGSNVSENTPE